MKPPSLEKVKEYFKEISCPEIEAEKFYDHYDTVGWKVGKSRTPMVRWKGAARNWKRNAIAYGHIPVIGKTTEKMWRCQCGAEIPEGKKWDHWCEYRKPASEETVNEVRKSIEGLGGHWKI